MAELELGRLDRRIVTVPDISIRQQLHHLRNSLGSAIAPKSRKTVGCFSIALLHPDQFSLDALYHPGGMVFSRKDPRFLKADVGKHARHYEPQHYSLTNCCHRRHGFYSVLNRNPASRHSLEAPPEELWTLCGLAFCGLVAVPETIR